MPARETPGEKWRARGRRLDSVDGLWRATQVAALCRELGGVQKLPNPLFQSLVASESQLELLRFAFPISIFFGVFWFVLACAVRSSWFMLIYLSAFELSGIGMLFTGLFFEKFPKRTKVAWMHIFAGLVVAFFLGSALSDALRLTP